MRRNGDIQRVRRPRRKDPPGTPLSPEEQALAERRRGVEELGAEISSRVSTSLFMTICTENAY